MQILRTRFLDFAKKPVFVLIISITILGLVTSLIAINFRRTDKEKFEEKKGTVITNFKEALQSYHSLLTAYGHLFTQLYSSNVLTTNNTFETELHLENRPEIRTIGFFTMQNGDTQLRYLERFGTSLTEIDTILESLNLRELALQTEIQNQSVISRINANYIIYIQPVPEAPENPSQNYVFILINQQDIFRMLSKISPGYIEYRIFDITSKPTPVFTHAMDDKVFFPFTRAHDTSDQIVTVGSFSWLFRFYFYDSYTEITHFMIIFLLLALGLGISLVLYTFSLRNYRATRKAEHLESQKDEFVAIASHELKTPLTSIKALNQILAEKMDSKGNVLYESFFRKMDNQIQRMENLINDLLDVSRIRSGKLTYKMSQFDLDLVVRSVAEEITTISRSHSVTVNGAITKPIYGDKDRITQVVTNILINASKYSPQAKLILVTLSQTDNEAIVAVQDFGIGISRDNQKRIFERFYRVSTDEHKYKGLGIGLFISSEIIRKHKGTIWVKSKKGKGATFSFSLPFDKRKGSV